MTRKKSRESQRKAQDQGKKQRLLMIAGFAGIVIVIVAAFFSLQEQESGTSDTQDLSEAPEVGALAPNFQLATNNGEEVTLSDFRGRPVAVTFMHTW